jgi:hypothetical protein
MRVNRGADFAHLFNGEENKITITFKLFNGQLELFYKEDEQRLFPVFKSARYDDGGVSAPNANKYSSKDMRDAQLVEYF